MSAGRVTHIATSTADTGSVDKVPAHPPQSWSRGHVAKQHHAWLRHVHNAHLSTAREYTPTRKVGRPVRRIATDVCVCFTSSTRPTFTSQSQSPRMAYGSGARRCASGHRQAEAFALAVAWGAYQRRVVQDNGCVGGRSVVEAAQQRGNSVPFPTSHGHAVHQLHSHKRRSRVTSGA